MIAQDILRYPCNISLKIKNGIFIAELVFYPQHIIFVLPPQIKLNPGFF